MLWWLAQNTVTAALLAGAVSALCRVVRFRPAVSHALWLIVLLKLLTPPIVAWPWALPEVLAQEGSASLRSEDASPADPHAARAPAQYVFARVESNPAPLTVAAPPGAEEQLGGIETAPVTSWQAGWLTAALVYLWLGGAVCMGLVQALRILRYRNLLAGGKRAPRCLMKQVDELAGKLHLRSPATRLVARIRSPFVWGLGRAKLFWPALLMSSLPSHCRRSVIAHELAHLRRRDHWVSWLETLAACVWWWNPLYWHVRRQLRLQAELACDAWVIGTLPEDRRVYAEALLEVTEHVSQTAAPVPALGMNGSARQVFERRLTMIMRERVPHRVPQAGLIAIGLLALLAIPGWSQNGEQPKKTSDAPKKESKLDNLELIYPLKELTLGEVVVYPQAELQLEKPATLKAEVLMLHDFQDVASDKSGSDGDREKRLQALEKRIAALLKEVQALRQSTKSSPPVPTPADKIKASAPKPVPLRIQVVPHRVDLSSTTWRAVEVKQRAPTEAVVSLARVTYKLPHDKAEVLSAFLRDHVKAKVMETKVEGDSLTITTTPETRKALDSLIGLIQGKPTAAKPSTDTKGKASLRLDREFLQQSQVESLRKVREERFLKLLEQVEKENRPKEEKPKP